VADLLAAAEAAADEAEASAAVEEVLSAAVPLAEEAGEEEYLVEAAADLPVVLEVLSDRVIHLFLYLRFIQADVVPPEAAEDLAVDA
jgi:hypothetical protein